MVVWFPVPLLSSWLGNLCKILRNAFTEPFPTSICLRDCIDNSSKRSLASATWGIPCVCMMLANMSSYALSISITTILPVCLSVCLSSVHSVLQKSAHKVCVVTSGNLPHFQLHPSARGTAQLEKQNSQKPLKQTLEGPCMHLQRLRAICGELCISGYGERTPILT